MVHSILIIKSPLRHLCSLDGPLEAARVLVCLLALEAAVTCPARDARVAAGEAAHRAQLPRRQPRLRDLGGEVAGHGAGGVALAVLGVQVAGVHLLLQQLRQVLPEPHLVVLQGPRLPLGSPLLDPAVPALVLEEAERLLAHDEVRMRVVLVIVSLESLQGLPGSSLTRSIIKNPS